MRLTGRRASAATGGDGFAHGLFLFRIQNARPTYHESEGFVQKACSRAQKRLSATRKVQHSFIPKITPIRQKTQNGVRSILIDMPEQPAGGNLHLHPKGPNFGLLMVLAGVALIVIFIIAYFFVMGHGSGMLPRSQPRKAEPTSQLVRPMPQDKTYTG
jgi:hypothetical protein